MATRWRPQTGQDINLAPLLDVIFCLLFFFILATSLRREQHALEVTLPRSDQSAARPRERDPMTVVIDEANRIVFEGKTLSAAQLEEALRTKPEAVRQAGVVIRSDGKADVQAFMDVSDACARAGLKSAMMQTTPRETGDGNNTDTSPATPPPTRRPRSTRK